jgi:hypothetical protein
MRVYDDFAAPGGWPGTRWTKFSPGPYELWDGNTVVECPGGPNGALTIRIPRYTLVHPPHHVKALTLSSAALAPPDEGPMIVTVDVAARIFGTEGNPFGVEPGDPRLSAAAIVIIEPESGMVTDFFISNDRICALYERLPYAQAKLGPYPAFTKLFATGVRTTAGQWHRCEMRYFPSPNAAEWWVDGRCVHRQERFGAPPGQDGPIVKIRSMRFGGGLFTLLDDIRDDRRTAGDNPAIPGLITARHGELFGQGGEISLRQFAVTGALEHFP